MIRVTQILSKKAQGNFWDEVSDVDWGDDTPSGPINETNYEDYLVDNLEEPIEPPSSSIRWDYMDEIPTANDVMGIPEDAEEIEYDNPFDLVADSLGSEAISFEYTNRFGAYAGRRHVEPHDWFVATTTGNNILVTYDLDVQDIRAFIIGNIHPGGVRYEGAVIPDRSFRDI